MQNITQIAENHTIISRKLFNEGMRAVENKSYKKEIKKLILILAIIYLVVVVWLLYTGGSLFFLFGESIFLGAILFWLVIMLPNTKRRNKYKALCQDTDIVPERTIKFYQDYLSVITNFGKETIILYNDITGFQETSHLYILNCNKNMNLLVSKDGFIFGDFNTLKSKVAGTGSLTHL
ncbi:MAG: YcxB family protein [Oliverpabstia sp.]